MRSRKKSGALIAAALLLIAAGLIAWRFLGKAPAAPVSVVNGDFSLSMLDVGNADCLLIQQGEHAMLIDAGEKDTADTVTDFLKKRGVTQLELVIATHPHADHIGGMTAVIDNYPISTFVMQPVPDALVPTSAAYTHMMEALIDRGVNVQSAQDGGSYTLGDAQITVYPCLGSYDDLNNYSVVCKITYGQKRFLLMGDAEKAVETNLLDAGYDLSADVLKVGHHGSRTSSQQKFLTAVNPSMALITCGVDNSYNHPSDEVMERLNDRRVTCYRVDLNGTTTVTTDGSTLSVTSEK